MRAMIWDLLDDTVSHMPHMLRKRLHQWFSTAAELLEPPPCQDRSCCWQAGARTVRFCSDDR